MRRWRPRLCLAWLRACPAGAGTIPLAAIVPRGFVDLIDRRAEHVKIQVRPG